MRMSTLTTAGQHGSRGLAREIRQEKETEGHMHQKERNKTGSICRQHEGVNTESQGIY